MVHHVRGLFINKYTKIHSIEHANPSLYSRDNTV